MHIMFKDHSVHIEDKQIPMSIIFGNYEGKRICMMNKAKGNWLPKKEKSNMSGYSISWETNVMRWNLYGTLTQVLNNSKVWQKEGKRKSQNQKEDITGNHKYEYG